LSALVGDAVFQRMYRLHRPRFYWILELIKPNLITDEDQARVSSELPVDPIIKLAVALRVAAGGSYLDIAFGYRISRESVTTTSTRSFLQLTCAWTTSTFRSTSKVFVIWKQPLNGFKVLHK
jgi:hypothetical protein